MTVSRAEKNRRLWVLYRSGRKVTPAAPIHDLINRRGLAEMHREAAKRWAEQEAEILARVEERQVRWEAFWREAMERMTMRSDDEIR